MTDSRENRTGFPGAAAVARAVRIFLDHAYPAGAPAGIERFIPPVEGQCEAWLMGDVVERTPPGATVHEARSFALRLGNERYPHMKLRFGRVPGKNSYVLTVDSHDAILKVPPGSPDHEALEDLKRYNAALAAEITAEMGRAGLPTERNYLREAIKRVRLRAKPAPGNPEGRQSPPGGVE